MSLLLNLPTHRISIRLNSKQRYEDIITNLQTHFVVYILILGARRIKLAHIALTTYTLIDASYLLLMFQRCTRMIPSHLPVTSPRVGIIHKCRADSNNPSPSMRRKSMQGT